MNSCFMVYWLVVLDGGVFINYAYDQPMLDISLPQILFQILLSFPSHPSFPFHPLHITSSQLIIRLFSIKIVYKG